MRGTSPNPPTPFPKREGGAGLSEAPPRFGEGLGRGCDAPAFPSASGSRLNAQSYRNTPAIRSATITAIPATSGGPTRLTRASGFVPVIFDPAALCLFDAASERALT